MSVTALSDSHRRDTSVTVKIHPSPSSREKSDAEEMVMIMRNATMRRPKHLFLILLLLSGHVVCQDTECLSGWGQGRTTIPAAWKNDGYCDCPVDGLDEPDTAACSGSTVGGWPGIPAATDHRYVHEGDTHLIYSCSFMH